ncbi:SusD/RagB family nutrient-binding outer membrane lipoprotein [uncultured Porphyromonas sp.]|uniref:SusD/RagB family nutrient-binding outer membrane lipoprotein n=1 Tax=uncultured Porphyromonas sp. TaxID=159274 RepID=UPI00262762B6|nr:SusD/RagB family nutrient-binding outer membrane lipoprotein [uncultured Porphyromonas sp.]
MNKKNMLLAGLASCAMLSLSTSCRDFDDVNNNPVAADREQVLPEYLINRGIMAAQLNPHVAERAFVLYWKTGGHQHRSGGLSLGGYNDGWSCDYYSRAATQGLKPLYEAIRLAEERIKDGSARPFESTILSAARIWRAYQLSEICDMFGVVAIDGYLGNNPTYVGAKEAYTFMLKELKEASETLKTSPSPKPSDQSQVTSLDYAYSYNAAKWRAFANSLRMRLAMRLSEVDPDIAKSNFEEAAAAGGILQASDRLEIQEKDGWDDLTGVMSRQWNHQMISPTYNNLVLGLGGVTSEKQLPEERYKKHIKAANYLGIRYQSHFPLTTTDPSRGFYFDGLPNTIDPRAYKTFIITGDTLNSEFCFYPSWAPDAAKKTEYSLKKVGESDQELEKIDTRFTWNTWVSGSWGTLSAINDLLQVGTMPRLANKYRNSKSKRIFFAEWETYFLLAEASIRGWHVPMSAKNAYEAGVKASFAYHGAGFVSEYLASTDYNRVGTSVAWDHTAEPNATVEMTYTDGYTKAKGNYTYRYPEMKSRLYTKAMNDHLTKIITQKFIANTPWLPLETWNDFRRLGLPFFETPAVEKPLDNMPQLSSSNFETVSIDFFPQRIPLPSNIASGNKQGHETAVKALGGEDKVFTPIYWAKKK